MLHTGGKINQILTFAKSISNPVIASGGISSLKEIYDLSQEVSNGIEGVVIGRALYDNKFSFSEALDIIKKVK